jgi:hypothetical protein
VKACLPKTIRKCFFCDDSGFFSGELFDLLESFTWGYLVKVKLKNLEKLLRQQTWVPVEGNKGIAICEFAYKANGWSKTRVLKAMRSVKICTGRISLDRNKLSRVTSMPATQVIMNWMPLDCMSYIRNVLSAKHGSNR